MPRRQSPRRKRSRLSKTKRRSPKRSLRRRRYRSASQPPLRNSPMGKILTAKHEAQREKGDEVQRRQRMKQLAALKAEEQALRLWVSGEMSGKPATVDRGFETPFIQGSDGSHILPFSRNDRVLGYKMGEDGIELYSVEIVLESEGGPFMFTPLTKWTPEEWHLIDTRTPLGMEQILNPDNEAGVHLFDVHARLVPEWGTVSSFVKEVTRPTSTTFKYIVGMDEYTVSPMVLINSLNDDNDDQIFHMALLHRKTPTGGVSVISFSAEKGFGYKLSLAEQTMPPVPAMGPKGKGTILAASSEQSLSSRRTSPFTVSLSRRKSRVDKPSPQGPAFARV